MKLVLSGVLLFLCALLPAQELSGTLDTKLRFSAGAGPAPAFSYGAEEYANLRLRIPVGEYAEIYGAVNIIAAAGNYLAASSAASGGYVSGENYAASIEPERLYLQISGDTFRWSGGLLRIPLGYGLVWGPMDFLNPRNPLEPDARLRAALGMLAIWYSGDDSKVQGFAAAPKDPSNQGGEGSRFGLSFDTHGERASLQLLYVFESPARYTASGLSADYPQGLHRMGLSVKADLEMGLVAEILYTLNPAAPEGLPGFAASAGADYSFFDGKLSVLAEYLYSGAASVSAQSAANPAGYAHQHYLYTSGSWKWSDFTLITLACALSLEDFSATPLASWEYEFFQGMILNITLRVPLDRESFNRGTGGELGPQQSGSRILGTIGLRIKF